MKCENRIQIPLVTTSGKVRIKRRKSTYEYGIPVATRQTPFSQDMYVEWQIGFDALLTDLNKGKKSTSLEHLQFIGSNGKKKALFELIVDESTAGVFLEMFKLFGMLSESHRHDTIEILKLIKENA